MFAIYGLIIGGLARLVLPGPESIGVLGTILAGIGGAVIGGLVGRVLFGDTNWLASLLLGTVGAVVLLLPFRMRRRAVR